MTTTASERRLSALAALLEETHPEPGRVPVLARLAADRLRRSLADYRRDRHSVGFALAYTARDILQDNLTSAAWAQTPFARLAPDPGAPSPLPPLPPSALLSDEEPTGLAEYLRSVIPPDAQILMRLVLTLGCRPDEVDELFGWPPRTAAAVLTTHLVALGVIPLSGHRGSGACWGPAWLALAPAAGGPACPACRSAVAPLRRLGRLLALRPSEAARIAVLGEAPDKETPPGASSSGPIRVRPLPASKPVSTVRSWRIALAVMTLAATLVPFLSAEDQTGAQPSRMDRAPASGQTRTSGGILAPGRLLEGSTIEAPPRFPPTTRSAPSSRSARLAPLEPFTGSARRTSRIAEPTGGLRVHDGRFFDHLFPRGAQAVRPGSSAD